MKPLPTIILNLIVGLPCAYMFVWLFPVVYTIQRFTYQLALTPSIDTTPFVLMGAYGIFIIGFYGIIAFYCLFTAAYESFNLYREYVKEREGYL